MKSTMEKYLKKKISESKNDVKYLSSEQKLEMENLKLKFTKFI
jgi:hypothetical protein